MAGASYPVQKFQNIDTASFVELQTVSRVNGRQVTYGPQIIISGYSYGGLAATKGTDGSVTYSLYSHLEYIDDLARGYDTVTDISGNQFPMTTAGGRIGNGGYRTETVSATIPLETLEQAQYQGLLLTIAAREHEHITSRRGPSSSVDIVEALRLANELNGGTNVETRTNDNYDIQIPAGYIQRFLEINN
jgi:hypothetical protein